MHELPVCFYEASHGVKCRFVQCFALVRGSRRIDRKDYFPTRHDIRMTKLYYIIDNRQHQLMNF